MDNGSVNICKQTSVNKCKHDLNIGIDLKELDNITSPLSIRIPATYKALYMRMTQSEKQIFKMGVISLLESIAKGVPSTVQSGPVVVNMNINMNNNSPKIENSITVNLSLKEALEELFGWLDRLASPVSQYSKSVPLFVKSDAAKYRAKVARLLREVN